MHYAPLRFVRSGAAVAVLAALTAVAVTVAGPSASAAPSLARPAMVWSVQPLTPVLTGMNPEGVSCVGATCVTAGYPCHTQCGGGPMVGQVFYSANAGVTWRLATVPSNVGDEFAVACATTSTCFALWGSGALIRSTDAGSTWSRVGLPAHFSSSSIACVPSRECVIAGTNEATNTSELVTDDGSGAWLPSRTAIPGMANPGSLACAAEGAHNAACLVIGSNAGGGATAAWTHDAGVSWVRVRFPRVISSNAAVSCSGPSRCVVASFLQVPGTAKIVSYSALSTDAGVTWHTYALPSGMIPWALSCVSSATCVLTGETTNEQARIFVSRTDGRTWMRQGVPGALASAYPRGIVTSISCEGTFCVAGGTAFSSDLSLTGGGYMVRGVFARGGAGHAS